MIQGLYEPFREWSNGGTIWLLSDPHFNDDDTKLMNKNWISPDEHVERINNTIHGNDTLICLGDCGSLSYIQKIKCRRKILIKGNHDDKGNSRYKRTHLMKAYPISIGDRKNLYKKLCVEYPNCSISICEGKDYNPPLEYLYDIDDRLFDEIYEGPLFISSKILLSHEPIEGLPFCVNIHGHVHNGRYEYKDSTGCKHINIASDVVNYEMRNLGELIKQGICSDISDIHRIAIDKARKNPIHKD